jgi:ATP-dependent Clp protease protease subunit
MDQRIVLDEEEEEVVRETKSQKVNQMIDLMLLKQRRVFLCSQVDDNSANEVIRKLWYLEAHDSGKPILLVINSPGGSVDSGFAMWDQIKMMRSPVTTLITGLAASMGSILSLVAGKGKRFATRHSRIMIHQPSIHGIIRGQATDLEIQAKEILKTRNLIINVYEQATGKDFNVLQKALDRDTWMNAEEALEFGLIDKIVSSYQEIGF